MGDKNRSSYEILHIVNSDKFTSAYINYMKMIMTEWRHTFIFLDNGLEISLVNSSNILRISSYKKLLTDMGVRKILNQSDKIIVSGVFGAENYLLLLTGKILKKTYFHFWGGDFYQFEDCKSFKKKLHKLILKECVKKCKGTIFLIDGEYQKFNKILKIEKEHMIAPVPNDPFNIIDYSKYWKLSNKSSKRIIIGNSATESNMHLEAFKLLSKYRENEIEIWCPLSYGDEAYRKLIIDKGREIFGDAFHPILDFMDKEDYVSFLTTCSVAIFNNNRQQAMGNINALLYLVKKVFLRQDTSMWTSYLNKGYSIYPIEIIESIDADSFFNIDTEVILRNHEIASRYLLSKHRSNAWYSILSA